VDSDFLVDVSEVRDTLASAEVISIFFPLLQKVLLIDTRHDQYEGPMVKVATVAASMEHRIRSLRRMRPRFDRPQTITLVPWPKHVETLTALGVWDLIANRLRDTGHTEAVEEGLKALKKLRRMEHNEVVSAITGQGYETLWARDE
jgi:hypothetical protein